MNEVKQFIEIFKKKLEEKLKAKTSWGRNELTVVINEALIDALTEMLENSTTKETEE